MKLEDLEKDWFRPFWAAKIRRPHAILLWKFPDHYEVYFHDALTVSTVLGLDLTWNFSMPYLSFKKELFHDYTEELLDKGFEIDVMGKDLGENVVDMEAFRRFKTTRTE